MSSHILVVEDEKHLGVGIKYNLGAEGYRVTLVEDGVTALRLLASDPEGFHLVVLDLMLPGMSGYTVCETIRDRGLNIPVLMLSARTLAEDRTRGFDAGANQYLSKPFDLDELLSRVKNLLQNQSAAGKTRPTAKAAEPVDEVSFGNVWVNFPAHEVTVEGKRVRMTSKELRLLRYLVENKNRVISRSELLAEVWQIRGNLQTRAVDNFIARLRKIIEDEPANPRHLITVRDAGYRFCLSPPNDGSVTSESGEADEGETADRQDTATSAVRRTESNGESPRENPSNGELTKGEPSDGVGSTAGQGPRREG